MLSAKHLKMFRIEARDFSTRLCRVIEQPAQKRWASLPQKEYTTKTRKKKYAAVIELSEPLKRELSRVVLAAWEAQQ